MQSTAIIQRLISEFQQELKNGQLPENTQPTLAIYHVGEQIARHLEDISANVAEIKDHLLSMERRP